MSITSAMQDTMKCEHRSEAAARRLAGAPNFVAGRLGVTVSRITGANAQQWLLSLSGAASG